VPFRTVLVDHRRCPGPNECASRHPARWRRARAQEALPCFFRRRSAFSHRDRKSLRRLDDTAQADDKRPTAFRTGQSTQVHWHRPIPCRRFWDPVAISGRVRRSPQSRLDLFCWQPVRAVADNNASTIARYLPPCPMFQTPIRESRIDHWRRVVNISLTISGFRVKARCTRGVTYD
jgi:hypothetical protein